MVHLSPDSRLLVSLVKQEQAYTNQLYNLLNTSRSSLSALVIYASSSPPPIAPTLKGIAAALSGADDAFSSYAEALTEWIEQLRAVSEKEEEVATIGRDREILVTRLIKVTQKTKVTPQSLLHGTPDGSSTVSFPTFNAKATAAQTELQACEAHLAEKEKELGRFRDHAIRRGLALRCEALARCGKVWNEMGRRALSLLEEMQNKYKSSNGSALNIHKSLPIHDLDADSAMSSLAPSQSASQIDTITGPSLAPIRSYSLNIPPAHQMTDIGIPGASVTMVKEETTSSSSEFEGPIEVHENSRNRVVFNNEVKKGPFGRSSPIRFPSVNTRSASSDTGPSRRSSKIIDGRERKSTGFLGNLAALFKTSVTGNPIISEDRRWGTRTDRHLRNAKTDLDDSDDDRRIQSSRLRKGRMRDTANEDILRPAPILVGAGVAPLSVPSFPSTDHSIHNWHGSLSRHSTLRSTFGQESNGPRTRANTLTTATPAAIDLREKSDRQIAHQRRSSLEGPWSTGARSSSSLPSAKTTSTSHFNKKSNDKGNNLMSILENSVHDKLGDPSLKLELARAPGNRPGYPSILVHHPPPLATSNGSSTAKRRSLPAGLGASSPASGTIERKPLRSALRHPNRDRSVSPIPSSSSNTTDDRGPRSSTIRSPSPELITMSTPRPTSVFRPDIPSTILESPRQSTALDGADTQIRMNPTEAPLQTEVTQRPASPASIKSEGSATSSSYETGIENFDEGKNEDIPTPSGPSPPLFAEKPLPATVLDAHAHEAALDIHEFSSGTSRETISGPSVRRKSVRLSSLPPEVLNRTPSQEIYEREDSFPVIVKPSLSAPPSTSLNGWKTRISVPLPNAIWQDSSSEEEDYKAARRALNFMDRQSNLN